ncbi:hypothetical protein G9C85_00270 [Halorubellus sp. JP-L1]|uniref:hypothetical protein n=1 Tax=Halorubellus sp. JP-L1 TaxID=2715753 RepID=UPI00140D76E6|nr:hypothetical protein [Halorubellus sp. JP-L1]NHN40073.1 hypothetical protein [Halorubellus sp. JP-L1]
MTDESERLASILAEATRPRCEHGHSGICLNVEDGRLDCPVPEHTPTRVYDLADASVVWETDDQEEVPTNEAATPQSDEVIDA